jgi:hypothetical protein
MTEQRKGARNPKVARVASRFSPEIERRIEVVADKMGLNKGTTVAMLASMGLAIFEQGLGLVPVAGSEEARQRIVDTFDNLVSAQLKE